MEINNTDEGARENNALAILQFLNVALNDKERDAVGNSLLLGSPHGTGDRRREPVNCLSSIRQRWT
jgi:hypothetical protein